MTQLNTAALQKALSSEFMAQVLVSQDKDCITVTLPDIGVASTGAEKPENRVMNFIKRQSDDGELAGFKGRMITFAYGQLMPVRV